MNSMHNGQCYLICKGYVSMCLNQKFLQGHLFMILKNILQAKIINYIINSFNLSLKTIIITFIQDSLQSNTDNVDIQHIYR